MNTKDILAEVEDFLENGEDIRNGSSIEMAENVKVLIYTTVEGDYTHVKGGLFYSDGETVLPIMTPVDVRYRDNGDFDIHRPLCKHFEEAAEYWKEDKRVDLADLVQYHFAAIFNAVNVIYDLESVDDEIDF